MHSTTLTNYFKKNFPIKYNFNLIKYNMKIIKNKYNETIYLIIIVSLINLIHNYKYSSNIDTNFQLIIF